jgi:hypothetical protein
VVIELSGAFVEPSAAWQREGINGRSKTANAPASEAVLPLNTRAGSPDMPKMFGFLVGGNGLINFMV